MFHYVILVKHHRMTYDVVKYIYDDYVIIVKYLLWYNIMVNVVVLFVYSETFTMMFHYEDIVKHIVSIT